MHHHLDQALDHLRRAEPRLVLVGGIPGSGKSTLAERLSREQGWMILGSDETRRDLGLRRQDIGDDAYRPETVDRVYDRLLDEAGQLLARGYSVVIDASWTAATHRSSARRVAADHGARLIELRCETPRAVCRSRIAARRPGETESEADPDIVDLLADRADDWPQALPIDTTEPDERLGPAVTTAALWLRTVSVTEAERR